MLYLYALARTSAALPELGLGLEEAAVYWLAHSDIAALVSPLGTSSVPVFAANVWRHEEIVETVLASRCVLPVRFGTVLTDEAALHSALAPCYAQLLADLDRLQGRVEMAVRVLWEGGEQASGRQSRRGSESAAQTASIAGTTGRAYMFARLEEERRDIAQRQQAEAVAREVHVPLARLALDSEKRLLATPRLLLTAAYLVEQDKVAAFREQVEQLGGAHAELQLLCTGPWPAYSFVSDIAAQSPCDGRIAEGLGE